MPHEAHEGDPVVARKDARIVQTHHRPTALEFFAGMGLVRRALEREGASEGGPGATWRTVYANDFDARKQALYRASFADGADVLDGRDVGVVAAGDLPAADLWTASFPCTDLSLAGRGLGIHAGQSGAVWAVLRLLGAVEEARKPRNLLFENVLGLLTSHGGADFRALVSAVNGLGYGVDALCVDAAHFTPQSRPRLFLIATRVEEGEGLVADPHDLAACAARPERVLRAMRAHDDLVWHARALPDLPRRMMRLEDALENVAEDSPVWWSRERAEYFLAQMHPGHRALAAKRIAADEVTYTPAFRRVRETVSEEGEAREADGRARMVKRSVIELRDDGQAGCLRTPKGGSAKQIVMRAGRGVFRVRHFTPRECARLQGVDSLPEGFSDSDLLFALGDAVCVPAVRWALDRMIEAPGEAAAGAAAAARVRETLFSAPRR